MGNLKQLLGKKLKQLRKANNMTQEQLAEKLGLSLPNISYIETGKIYPSVETQEKICQILNLDYYELYMFNRLPDDTTMKLELISAMDSNPELLKKLYKFYKFM